MKRAEDFLLDQPGPIPWQIPEGGRAAFEPVNLFLGQGAHALEVAVATAASRPNVSDVRLLWRRRKGGRPAPLLLVVLYPIEAGLEAATCGPVGEDPAVAIGRDPGQVERIATTALGEPNRNAAIRFLTEALSEADTELPGIRNVGMFATHELTYGVPRRDDWPALSELGRNLLGERGQGLVTSLGFQVEQLGSATSVLRLLDSGQKAAVAVFLDETETPEGTSPRFGASSPVTHALAQADAERLPYVVVTRGSQIRVYSAERDVGVGRKGRAETFVEANLALLPDDMAGYLPLLFGADALRPDGSFQEVLELSKDFSTNLGERLRDRVYKDVVPQLARIVSQRFTSKAPSEKDLADLYEMAMVILFRLLFVAYAEDKDLLPYRTNGRYQRNALKTLARDLADMANEGRTDFDTHATDLWDQVTSLWKAVDQGNSDWAVPPYNGGMFSSDPSVSTVGARIDEISVTNAELGPALRALLVDQGDGGVFGPVDFRALSVREFGTIYEGLLESSLAVAPSDLTTADDGTYLPAIGDAHVVVSAGDLYLHDRSGARKATGSYFTKPFAVEHLLEHALEPALDEHLKRLQALLEQGEESVAAEFFFDFRVADIAMGSGHFLVAAVDHIEARLSSFLADHPIAGVTNELQRLAAAARQNLGDLAEGLEIEQATLLRRQVARRCIYGVDLNLIAVELARLGMWIHTFVPGLPLSFLDHNLVQGDSLTGIGTLDEAVDAVIPEKTAPGTKRVLRSDIRDLLQRAEPSLRRLAKTADASAQEIRDARAAHQEAREAVETVRKLFDLACAVRLGEVDPIADFGENRISSNRRLPDAERLARELKALHFPIVFPEVFLRDNPGFDCIIGNPPWEEATVEELGFWALRFPGLKSMTQRQQAEELAELRANRADLVEEFEQARENAERLRRVLVAGPYPGMGTGDPDLYKAFTWRFWRLIREDGAIGVVLPRSALTASGSATWRKQVLEEGAFADTTLLLNRAGWVFDDAEHRYTIGLVAIRKGPDHIGHIRTRGPYSSLEAYFKARVEDPAVFASDAFVTWTEHASFPLLPSAESVDVFLKLRSHPRFDSDEYIWSARAVRELDATNDKGQMLFDPASTDRLWPVYKGASFNLWTPDTGEYYAWADPDHITDYLYEKRKRQARYSRSVFSALPSEVIDNRASLPCLRPRVAFRDVARATDSRTVIACLLPPSVVISNTGPYLLFTSGDPVDETFVLGVLASIPLDWYSRRIVETHVNFHILNAFPLPNPETHDPLRRRVVELAATLAAVDERYDVWAQSVGVERRSLAPDERDDQIYELDAVVAHLYGLDEADVTHIFETFHEGWDYRFRLERVLTYFREWR